jgi:hypothetical protein
VKADELKMRARLGVPADAARVLIFCESSHWDTNWLKTSEQYFADRVAPILLHVLRALERDPKRVYGIESLFFFKLFWERHPELRARVRTLFERRQLRLLTTAFTTPDTLLPHVETLLRDFQLAHEWLERNGLPDAPGTAYFPDNFGHSPHLPSLMRSIGVGAVGLTRIDGMYFIGADWRGRGHFPRPQSTAALLEQVHRSHDFVWRDDTGAEVLCHWNAHTYFMGDMLAHAGIIRWNGQTYALPWRTRGHIARRIDGYVKKLEPFARTPYLCCPIGMDFNDPIEDLGELLERYNRERYPQTGTWAVLAGLDDYFALVQCYRQALPVLDADPNPYWMGFLATRPEVKQRPTRIARSLLLAEQLSATCERDDQLEHALHEGWSTLVLSNHHDYIPGTSPDAVWHSEQKPWLDAAEAAAKRALALAETDARAEGVTPGAERAALEAAPEVVVDERPRSDEVLIETKHYRLKLSRAHGGCLTSFVTRDGELLDGFGFDLVAFHDEGGLWRLGHEFAGGRFSELQRASTGPAQLSLSRQPGEVRVILRSELQGEPWTRTLICRADDPFLKLRVEGVARARVTVTCRFETRLHPSTLQMDTVGGVIERPREKLYSPTFWPVPSRLSVRDGHALHALFEAPTAASLSAAGALEWIVARNAEKERAFRWLPVLAHPIGGSNPDVQVHEAALLGGPCPVALASAQRQIELNWLPAAERSAGRSVRERVRCDTDGVVVKALKRAARGEGVMLRVFCESPTGACVRLKLHDAAVKKAWLSDALERTGAPLTVEPDGTVVVPVTERMTSLKLA